MKKDKTSIPPSTTIKIIKVIDILKEQYTSKNSELSITNKYRKSNNNNTNLQTYSSTSPKYSVLRDQNSDFSSGRPNENPFF